MKRIAIVYRYIPRYRKKFYLGLRERLKENNIELILVYGQPGKNDKLRRDEVHFDWAIKQSNYIIPFFGHELYWQPVFKHLKNLDLVIVEQASKLLINYLLLFQNALRIKKVAFWGHGKNFQENTKNNFAEWIKKKVSKSVHWWFAYNEMSVTIIRDLGFPKNKITNVQNAIDTKHLSQLFQNLSDAETKNVRSELELRGSNVAIYIGGMYPEKRLRFLFEALKFIRTELPDFEMIFIGDGVDSRYVEDFSKKKPWTHYLGPKFSSEIVPYCAISKFLLVPGAVGLVVLDSFALETPIITTRSLNHGPEISYLENGINGIIIKAANDPILYAKTVINLFRDEQRNRELIDGCRASKEKYTIESMIDNFTKGIIDALGS